FSQSHRHAISPSSFLDPDARLIESAPATGTNRIELYTEAYARQYELGDKNAAKVYADCARAANAAGLGLNAGHDLSLENIKYFKDNVPGLLEVSIGHALIAEALYMGLETTIQQYLNLLK